MRNWNGIHVQSAPVEVQPHLTKIDKQLFELTSGVKKLADGLLPDSSGQSIPSGTRGPAGPAGPQGPAGANGTNGTNGADGVGFTTGDKGDITISTTTLPCDTLTVDTDAITYAKMQNISAASTLLGRGSAAGSGNVEEITLGTNLTMSGTTLSAAGGSGDVAGDDTTTTVQNIVAYNATDGKHITELTGTQGDILYHNGTSWAKLGAGTADYVLRAAGAGANPAWKPNKLYNGSTAVATGFATDTYLDGARILIPNNSLKIGSLYRCTFSVSKTAAGTAGPTMDVRVGTNGTIADGSIKTLSWTVQTAVVDSGMFDIFILMRSVGSGASGVAQILANRTHKLSVTGLGGTNSVSEPAIQTSTGFDTTISSTYIGLSLSAGVSSVWTIEYVAASLENLA